MSIRRVAIIYNDKPRPETTGFYCRRALGGLVEVEHFLPGDLARIPRSGFDLYLHIDDGLHYRLPAGLHPSAWWAIDTHLDWAWCLEKARDFDFVFAAQRDGAERLRLQGIASAQWLPLACDREIHRKHEVEKAFDVCFVGNLFFGPRADLVGLLQRRFAKMFVGQCYFEEMARTFSAARIVFNRSVAGDINMRVFEALASGSLLLTNDLKSNGQDELFQDGVHLATYADAEELLYKASFYLANESARARIASAGLAEVAARHTYGQRMRQLLEVVENGLPTTAIRKTPPSAPDAHAPASSSNHDDPAYFDFARPELLELIPRAAGKVLDIGCGAGRLGQALKARQQAEVTGVELNAGAAGIARQHLDHVHVADLEQWQAPSASFDVIVCGDVLEHLRDPLRLLRRARGWLGQDGRLIASVPNVRHHSVIRGLLEGNWTYEPAGLLDRDHLRFFTRREIEKLFYRAGFTISQMRVVPGPGHADWQARQRPGEVKVGRLHIGNMPGAEAEEFYAYQYIVSAVPAPAVEHGLTSIVIVTHNQLACTRQCLDSICQYTDEPFELIVVDNASSDGTADYLRARADVKLILNESNRGFPAAANQGIHAAGGQQVLLLNNDTVVTTGWLRRLLRALHGDPKIGLAGPCSNCVSGPQQVETRYDDLSALDGFAWEWGKANDGAVVDSDRLVGFCLLIRRDVIDTIGLLDECFGIGCFEDDDYCLRALRAGYRAVIARDAFVHHEGGQTFRGSGVDFADLMRKNERLFREKWQGNGARERADCQSALQGKEADCKSAPQGKLSVRATGNGLFLDRDTVQLSLCMIVRDNERTIRACLESIRPWVDEMVVVDTGSKDSTPRIAAGLGARVFRFPWCDSFAAARNESLRHARGGWIFWMDSDDTIDQANGRALRRLAHGPHDPAVLGHVMQVHCPGPGGNGDRHVTVVDHVKLFRNLPALRFEGRIHEQIIPAIRRAGGDIAWSDIFVVHSGYDHSADGQAKKKERDLRLLHLELQEQPQHPFTLFNLGMTYADIRDYEQAVGYLRRSLAVSRQTESHLRKAYALLVHSLAQQGKMDDAWESCRQGLRLFPKDAELLFRKAVLLQETGRLQEAATAYLDLLHTDEERHFSSVVRGIKGHLARHNLALVYTQVGNMLEARKQWERALAEEAGYPPALHALDKLARSAISA